MRLLYSILLLVATTGTSVASLPGDNPDGSERRGTPSTVVFPEVLDIILDDARRASEVSRDIANGLTFERLQSMVSELHTNQSLIAPFFNELNREGFWSLTWEMNDVQLIMGSKNAEFLSAHKTVLSQLLSMCDIPTLDAYYGKIFDRTLTEAEYNQLITPVRARPELSTILAKPFDPTATTDLVYIFSLAHEREIFILQLIHRLNYAELLLRTRLTEAERTKNYCAVENRESLFQYSVSEAVEGVFSVYMQRQDINMDVLQEEHYVQKSYDHKTWLFAVTDRDFARLRPIIRFMSPLSLTKLLFEDSKKAILDKRKVGSEAVETLVEIAKERYLRKHGEDDFTFYSEHKS